MWQAEEAGKLVWRSSLEDPRTGKILFFKSLPLLFEFLEKTGNMPGVGSSPPTPERENDASLNPRAPPQDLV